MTVCPELVAVVTLGTVRRCNKFCINEACRCMQEVAAG